MKKNNNKSLSSVFFIGAVSAAFGAGMAASAPGLEGIAVPVTLSAVVLLYLNRLHRDRRRELSREDLEGRARNALLQSVNEGVAILDAEFRVLEVNRPLLNTFGCSAEEIVNAEPPHWIVDGEERRACRLMPPVLRRHGNWQGGIRFRRKNGEAFTAFVDIRQIRNEKGEVTRFVAVISNPNGNQEHPRFTDWSGRHVLTHLPNRACFVQELESTVGGGGHREFLAVLLFDIAQFKRINETFGRQGGDRVLRLIANRIHRLLRKEDLLAHAGGDVFLVMADRVATSADAASIAQKLLDGLCEPLRLDGYELRLGASIGISLYPEDTDRADQLVQCAESALHRAKESGRNNFRFYCREFRANTADRLMLEMGLWRAIQRNEFRLCYQWQVELGSRRIVGVEALLRWHQPDVGSIAPDQFIPLAEENGNIVPIGEWVMRTACQQGRVWIDQGVDVGRIAVNVAGKQLVHPEFEDMLNRVLNETRFPPDQLELEVTESSLISHSDSAVETLARARGRGIAVAIDDFGTGYSSLSYLGRLPVDTVKIDRSFIKDVPGDAAATSVVRAVIAMGRSLGLRVVAEGIEREDQEMFLRSQGCLHGQGFLYGKPLPVEKLSVSTNV